MKRVSRITDPEEFTTEAQREALRELRSQRHQRMLRSVCWSIAILLFALGGTKLPIIS
jgi:hypothetical protein